MRLQSGRGLGTLALVLLSGGAGWWLHGLARPPQPPVQAAASAPAPEPPRASLLAFPRVAGGDGADAGGDDVVEVHPDGSVSLRVQHRPPAWVMAELCRQGARELLGCGRPVAAAPQPSPATPSTLTPAPDTGVPDTAQLQRRLRDPAESVRYQALMQARAEGLPLPEATLRGLMETDSSDRVRIEAFEGFVESHSGSDDQLRAALQSVLRIPHAALQTRAREQLDELEESLRQDAAAAQQPPRF